MPFITYKPTKGYRNPGKFIRVGSTAWMTLSRALCQELKITKGIKHELMFDLEACQLAIKIAPADSNGYSRGIAMNKHGAGAINAATFFKQINVRAPAKSMSFSPRIEGDMLILDYPAALVPKT